MSEAGRHADFSPALSSPPRRFSDLAASLLMIMNFLSLQIPYFHSMFTNGMKESSQHEIHLDERGETIDSDAFEALINFAYSGKVSISTSNVQSLMMTASFLQLSRVRDACAEFLMARLSPNNVLGIKSFADSLGCSILVAACHKFVKKFFAKVRHKFLDIDVY